MKDKVEILARLLQNNHITVEEFKVLFEKEIQYIYNYYPYYRYKTYDFPFVGSLYYTTGSTLSTSGDSEVVNSFTSHVKDTLGENLYNKVFSNNEHVEQK